RSALRVEERGQLRAPAGQALLHFEELRPRHPPAFFEPRELVLDLVLWNLIPQRLCALNEHDGASGDDARRDADAFQTLHASSPKPDSTSATSALTASRSSDPSAEIVIVDPRAAASSRMPMMLLPSISRRSRATRTFA